MGLNSYSSAHCYNIMDVQNIRNNITWDDWIFLTHVCDQVDGNEDSHKYSKPMVWIGFYIAIASLFCLIAMVADLVHGFRNRKTWFPCKYFSLSAASITVIAVAMKLTLDMSTPMPGDMDQATKLGSMAFMCTMMANLMPSLGSMDNKTLLANIAGLAILVITMIVNVFIEINTGVINHEVDIHTRSFGKYYFIPVAYTYMAMIIFLLALFISSAITIPITKQILEFKYQTTETALNDHHLEHTTLDKLKQHVRRFWVMVETSSPQFVLANNPLSFASSTICIIGLAINIFLFIEILQHRRFLNCQSDYKLSIGAIYITQFIGVVVGSIAPIIRCFTVLRFELAPKSNRNPFTDFNVEKFWTEKLCDWKNNQMLFLSLGRRSRNLVHNLKNLILSICIGFQKIIVVSCKMIQLFLIVILLCIVYFSYYWDSLKAMSGTTSIASTNDYRSEDLGNYVLQLKGDKRLAEKTLKIVLKSMNRVILKGEKEQHNNLLRLLEHCNGFGGVRNFDMEEVQSLLSVELSNSWSLPIITLTCITISLPNIHNDKKDCFLKSVSESLLYTHLVEESLNCESEYVAIHRASTSLWHEVEDNYKWLDNTLKINAYNGKTSMEILKWFADKAKEIVMETKRSANREKVDNSSNKLIVANSMYRIAQTILLNYQSKTEPVTEEELFVLLYTMIADIVVACFTNIPRVIATKCAESVIEKREDSIESAAMLLGTTTKIIDILEVIELPNMDPDKMAYIDEWRLHMKQSIP